MRAKISCGCAYSPNRQRLVAKGTLDDANEQRIPECVFSWIRSCASSASLVVSFELGHQPIFAITHTGLQTGRFECASNRMNPLRVIIA